MGAPASPGVGHSGLSRPLIVGIIVVSTLALSLFVSLGPLSPPAAVAPAPLLPVGVSSHGESFGVDEPLASATPGNQRVLKRLFASERECEEMIALTSPPTVLQQTLHSVGLYGIGVHGLARLRDRARLATLARVRARMLALAKSHFGREDVWPHTTHLTVRKPVFQEDPVCEGAGNCSYQYLHTAEWSSGVHADNCMWNPSNDECEFLPCCHMRAYSLVLYLSRCSGGEFVFDKIEREGVPMEIIKPEVGSLVMFPGNVNNRHGVGRLRDTQNRYTLYLWLTHNASLAEPTFPWMSLHEKSDGLRGPGLV